MSVFKFCDDLTLHKAVEKFFHYTSVYHDFGLKWEKRSSDNLDQLCSPKINLDLGYLVDPRKAGIPSYFQTY